MSIDPAELTGSESVYCINEAQLKTAYSMIHDNSAIKELVYKLEKDLSRNERAALAFLLIDSLTKSAVSKTA